MNPYTKGENMQKLAPIAGVILLAIALAYPTYDFAKDFVNKRDLRVQNTHYNFSKYLRYGS
jgi:hypothetical protein